MCWPQAQAQQPAWCVCESVAMLWSWLLLQPVVCALPAVTGMGLQRVACHVSVLTEWVQVLCESEGPWGVSQHTSRWRWRLGYNSSWQVAGERVKR